MADNNGFLFGADHPLYCIKHWKDDIFIVSGGGGKAKTGIKNKVSFHRLLTTNGNQSVSSRSYYSSDCLCQRETGFDLLMQFSISPKDASVLAASVESDCKLYSIKEKESGDSGEEKEAKVESLTYTDKEKEIEESEKESKESEEENVKENEEEEGDSSKEDDEVDEDGELDLFELNETAAVTSDEHSKDPSQNVVRFSFDGSHVLTGGDDGCLRIWKLPDLKAVVSSRAHKGEITDIAVHPSKELSVSISRDGVAKVWEGLDDKEEVTEFTAAKDYRFRACGFSNYKDVQEFFTISSPIKWKNRSRQYCYLTKWDTQKWKTLKSTSTGTTMLTAMTIYEQYIGIGDASGGLFVYTTNLKAFLKILSVHSSSVTDLCFMSHDKGEEKEKELVLLSVSVDRSCYINEVKQKGNWWSKYLILLTVVVLLLAIFAESIWTF
ncbi:PREDICTED: prolactin regulatory element-binding protein-like [Amphimedon queenslandica]|uniref:Uncharacterized protein n=1 Tax=Amphimedon queenslandica TaxID=400682 RepID=A0A1X7VGL5_AMPQE|nr:PREDICTED: prolactin regulatory element-binding protein-like [Amphimedon queenslandica]|eukprot:XP_011410326.1 PREDICTED: prolactin regulatory element-binding protein-like [Amphimedon queenslandica]